MITTDYVATMAAYNRWQNTSIYGAASGLSDADRREDRGAFFGSIHRTLSHVAWGDSIWLSRFSMGDAPSVGIDTSADWISDWDRLVETRAKIDDAIDQLAAEVSPETLASDLSFYSGVLGCDVTRPFALCLTHFFKHETHHRGQVHAMLTAAGTKPEATDLFLMPMSYADKFKRGE